MSSFVLRKVDPLLWQRAREKAKRKGLALVAIVESMIAAWLEQD